jgi:hypothetical protein
MKLVTFPRNKKKTVRLLKFAETIQKRAQEAKVSLILYGSLAYVAYTHDSTYALKDLDFLIPESGFRKICKQLDKRRIKYKYFPEWHTVQIEKKDLKIELDSQDFWQPRLSKRREVLIINNQRFKMVTKSSLKAIYKRAAKRSKDNPQNNQRKYNKLNE